MICIPLSATTNARLMDLIARAGAEPADLYEYRFDCLEEPPRVEELIAASSRPVLATCRSVAEGGGFAGAAAARRAILRRALAAGAAYVDAEAADLHALEGCGGAVRIVSMHDFARTPDDLGPLIAELSAAGADWIKFAVTANGFGDTLRVLHSLAACRRPAIGIAMGAAGVATRILGPRFGSAITFGSLDSGLESAPGQPTAKDLAEVYRVDRIDEHTELHGWLGHPDRFAAGHAAQNRAYARAGLNAVCIPFPTADALDFLDAVPDGIGLRRVLVDDCHGAAALAWAGDAGIGARRAGTANILRRMDGYWFADRVETPPVGEIVAGVLAASG